MSDTPKSVAFIHAECTIEGLKARIRQLELLNAGLTIQLTRAGVKS